MGEAAGFASRIVRLGHEIEAIGPSHLKAAATEARVTILASVSRAAGGDLALSHVRSKSGKAGTLGAKVNASKDTATPTAEVQATGPLQILDNKAKPHIIMGKGTAVQRRTSKARVKSGKSQFTASSPRLKTPRGPRFVVHHPGHGGKHSWRAGTEPAKKKASTVLSDSYRRTVATLGGT
jgi:hypothetical protein